MPHHQCTAALLEATCTAHWSGLLCTTGLQPGCVTANTSVKIFCSPRCALPHRSGVLCDADSKLMAAAFSPYSHAVQHLFPQDHRELAMCQPAATCIGSEAQRQLCLRVYLCPKSLCKTYLSTFWIDSSQA